MATTWTIEVDRERNGIYPNYVISVQWFVGMCETYQLTADNAILIG